MVNDAGANRFTACPLPPAGPHAAGTLTQTAGRRFGGVFGGLFGGVSGRKARPPKPPPKAGHPIGTAAPYPEFPGAVARLRRKPTS
jgi:hypothetical protein